MKTYKYNINGNDYEVAVEGIENYVATVTVNGESYTVKMPEPEKPALYFLRKSLAKLIIFMVLFLIGILVYIQ